MEIKNVLLMVLVTFVFVALFIPVVKKMAEFIGAMDIPNARKVHKVPIPRLGGLGIYAGFLLGYMLFGVHSVQMNAILIGSFIILVTGIFDDIKPVPAKWKLLAQTVGASIVPLYGGILLQDISAFGLYIDFGILAYPITIIFIVAIINCINLIDGLDGLSSGIASIYFLTIGVIAMLLNNSNGLDIILTFIMLGSTLGFLVHNFNPAKIFMGDTGSLALGGVMGAVAILTHRELTLLVVALVFVIETLSVILQVIWVKLFHHKLFLMTPLHHHFEKLGWSETDIVKLFCTFGLILAMLGILFGVWL